MGYIKRRGVDDVIGMVVLGSGENGTRCESRVTKIARAQVYTFCSLGFRFTVSLG